MERLLAILLLFLSSISLCHANYENYSHENYILPQGTHLLAAKGIDGSIVELEDGAQFTIADSDRDEIMEWRTYTPIAISPNTYWYSNHDFLMTNCLTGTYVRAKFTEEPLTEHPFTNTIFYIDPFEGIIILEDGRGNQTSWEIDQQDLELSRQWEKDETIVIGVYDNWYSKFVSKSRFILINYKNLSTTKFIRANIMPH